MKDELFKEFNIDIEDLLLSSYNYNEKSFLYYSSKDTIFINMIINDNYHYLLNNEEINKKYQESEDKNDFLIQELNKAEHHYLLNNIKSTKLKKIFDGTIIIDDNIDDNKIFDPINFYDDLSINDNMFNYKYFNIHFIVELINKYLEDLENINLPSIYLNDEEYFKEISVNTILLIYNNYDKLISIINNLSIFIRNAGALNNDTEKIEKAIKELDDSNFINLLKNELPSTNQNRRRNKKYKIHRGGAFNIYNIYKKKIDEIKEIKKKTIPTSIMYSIRSSIQKIYDLIKDIIEYYNNVIETIDKIYALRYFENKNINLYTNRFVLINIENLPKNIMDYYYNFFDSNIIKKEEIEKIFIKLNDYNFNEIYDNIILTYDNFHINEKYYMNIFIFEKIEDEIKYRKKKKEISFNDISNYINEEQNGDYILKESENINEENSKFNTGYLYQKFSKKDYETILFEEKTFSIVEKNNKIYLKKFNDEIDENFDGNFIFKNKIYDKDDIIILAIYYYELFLYNYLKEIKEIIICESNNIFNSVKCKFSEKYSSENKDTKRIIKNLDKILKNEEQMMAIIKLKFNNIINLILEYESNIEVNKIIKTLFENSEQFNKIRDLVQKYEDNDLDNFSFKIKNLLDVRSYIIDNFKEIDDRNYSNKIINNTCLNKTSLNMINNFKFNLRLPDKNGNTVIHRLIDQLNEEGIEKLLNPKTGDTAIITFKNKNNQTPIEYLLEILNIIKKKYVKKVITEKIEEVALKIYEDNVKIYQNSDNIINEIKLKWTLKDTKTIYSYSLDQFNEYLWLKLYEFKNNINNEDIDNLKNILNNQRNIKEELLIRSIDINDINKKLERMFLKTDNKKNIENNLMEKNCNELINLNNAKNNLLKIRDNKLFNNSDIEKEINNIEEEIKIKENINVDVENFIKVFNNNQINRISEITCILEEYKTKLIKKFNLNMEEFFKLSKNLENDYLKLLHLFYDIKIEEEGVLYISDFNYELICSDITELKDKETISYNKYFQNHLNTIFMDFNDLEKYEDYSINYVNYQLLEIININMVSTISWEIYNGLLKYVLEKYDLESSKKEKPLEKKLIIKNIKILLKNKIFDILSIKNPDKIYETSEFYKDLIINTFMNITEKKVIDEDKNNMGQIIDFYSRIIENLVSLFYNDIKDNLIDQRKIVILLKIYHKLKKYDKIINN